MTPFIIIPAVIGLALGLIGMISGMVRNIFIAVIISAAFGLAGYIVYQEFVA